MPSPLRSPTAWVATSLLLVACGASPTDAPSASSAVAPAGDVGAEDMTDDELRTTTSCERPKQYAVSLRAGACAEVAGTRGRWVPGALSSDLPDELASTACIFRWQPDRRARPDRASLEALPELDAMVAMCGASSSPRLAVARKIPHLDNVGMGGAVGCDVCGVIGRERKLWAILPARTYLKQLEVPLSDGRSQAFQIDSEVEAGVLEIELPDDLPRGVAYAQGRVPIW
ncbi:MAG: hypothetical protein KC657_24675 [Myxococcales bacterium]|nr:hypothetical protein [Myxococcales bacterium]